MGKIVGVISGDVMHAVAMSMLLGMTLGAAADAAAPVRRKIPLLTDLLLCIWMVWIWLKIAFEICAGDLRTGYCAAAALGAFGWRRWISPLTRTFFVKIWVLVCSVFDTALIPMKFFQKKLIFLKKTLSN